jgi:hypothetical protein
MTRVRRGPAGAGPRGTVPGTVPGAGPGPTVTAGAAGSAAPHRR